MAKLRGVETRKQAAQRMMLIPCENVKRMICSEDKIENGSSACTESSNDADGAGQASWCGGSRKRARPSADQSHEHLERNHW